jgi:autophagy-related protein 18
MAFSYDSTLLCVSSATETVHVFKLGPKTEQSPTSPVNERAGPARRVSDRSFGSREDTPSDVDSSEYDVARNHNGTFAGMIRRSSQNVTKSFASTLGGYLPTVVTEMLEPTRDFAWFKVPRRRGVTTIKSIVGMNPDRPEVMVATTDGDFLVYAINTEKGGEAELIKQES